MPVCTFPSAPGIRAAPAFLASEAGDTLIEVVIAALLVGLIVGATFFGFDVVNRSTANDRQRERAAQLAQQDQDRLRGLQMTDLENLAPSTRVETVDNTKYSITSSVHFYSDANGGNTCSLTSGTPTADYLTTNSSVTWAGAHAPVSAESIVTPPVGGAIIVDVNDSNANPLSNVAITLSGASTASGFTDASGCATFGGLPLGNYTISASKAGYVDPNGLSTASTSATAVAGTTAQKELVMGQPGGINATFTTTYGGTSHASSQDEIVLYNSQMATPSVYGTLSSYASSIASGTTVYPFSTAAAVYAGTCTADQPAAFGATNPTATITTGGTANVTVALPAMILDVYSGNSAGSPGSLENASDVHITDTGCGNTKHVLPVATGAASAAHGSLYDPGQPFGSFSVCVDNGNAWYSKHQTATVSDTNLAAGTVTTFYLGSGSSGGCS